ncbi:contact-dependent growth inhibition system immunity protein [Streptomyces sp. NBC_01197]|uniref:contact-dependent growth inhibition system immunity protein n=1 Tax=Streptomyces sp. NBC_01197 TaxID=2903768 RepID=UPI002E106099|nr:contact-dependent growth inhibition system immunity protein [Streptomyces sp. NBC_01197]
MTQPDIFDDDAPWAEWLPELRLLLEAYSSVVREERFTDTDEITSKAMRSYLRMATYYPGRAFRVTREILDVLKYGLDEVDVASNLASMPPMITPPGRTREDCLIAMLPHLAAFTERGEVAEPAIPETSWEWCERLPNLNNLLGGYFHQDAELPTDALLDEYTAAGAGGPEHEVAAAAKEIGELLEICPAEECVEEAVEGLACSLMPPEGQTYTQWMDHMAKRLNAHLEAVGYQPPVGRNPAYPPHDKRAVVQQ